MSGARTHPFVGTGSLLRLALRRDRIMLPVWTLVFVAMAATSASATSGLYPTAASRVAAATANNGTPALVALYGRIYDPNSLGALAMLKMTGLGAALIAVLAIVVVVRHTRAEEEAGRLELLGATVVGRYASVSAALLIALGSNLALGALTAVSLLGAGLPAAGSVAFGLAWTGVGLTFSAIAAVAAQLTQGGRSAIGIAAAVLGTVYVLRAAGDAAGAEGPRWLSWLSPIGWGQQVRPYAGERWWVLLLLGGFTVLATCAAYALVARRDLGAGLLPTRAGPAHAPAGLRGPLALAWRLQRGVLLGWLAYFLLLGAVLGNIASNVGDFLGSDQAKDFITKLGGQKALTDAFIAADLGIAGVLAAAFGVQSALRLRSEESEQRAEPVLATAVSRTSWAAGHIVVALAGTAALLTAAGLGAGITYAAASGDVDQLGRVLGAALVRLPAAWVLTGIAVAAFGLAPRAVAVGWAALVAFLLLGELGPLLGLDQAVMDVSPFAHVPNLPGGAMSWTPVIWLAAVVALLLAAGLAGFRRRDVAAV